MKVGRIVKIAGICTSVSALLLSTLSVAAIARQDNVEWYAELYVENLDYIVVSVDLSGLLTNRYIEDVSFDVIFYGAQNRTAKQTFDFTDPPRLKAGVVHQRYFRHYHGFAQSAKGGDLSYTTGIEGAVFRKLPGAAQERKKSGERIQASNIQLSGAVPPPTSSRRTGEAAALDPERDLSISFSTNRESGDPGYVFGTVKNKSSNTYPCVRLEFNLFTRFDMRRSGEKTRRLGVLRTEVKNIQPHSISDYKERLPSPAGIGLKSVSVCREGPSAQPGKSRRPKTGPAPTFRRAPPTFRTAPSPTTTG